MRGFSFLYLLLSGWRDDAEIDGTAVATGRFTITGRRYEVFLRSNIRASIYKGLLREIRAGVVARSRRKLCLYEEFDLKISVDPTDP